MKFPGDHRLNDTADAASDRSFLSEMRLGEQRDVQGVSTGKGWKPPTISDVLILRVSLFSAALIPALWQSGLCTLSFQRLGALLLGTLLLLAVRSVPMADMREHALAFSAPLIFGLSLWAGPGTAALAALLAHLLLARFVSRGATARGRTVQQGAGLALAALAAGNLWAAVPTHIPLTAPRTLEQSHVVILSAGALLAACGFVSVLLLLDRLPVRLGGAPPYAFGRNLLIMSLTLLPAVLLAPLGAILGLIVGLPFLLLLLLGAQVVRLTAEADSLRRQIRTAEAMGRASVNDSPMLSPSALLDRFLTLAQELVKAERALVWMFDRETNLLTPVVALPNAGTFAGQSIPYGEGLIGHTATRTRPRLVTDAATDLHRGVQEAASGAWLLYPILVHEELLGVAQWTRPTGRPFSIDDIARLDSLVPQATIALENIMIRERIHHLAATDGLTGLWNQRRMTDLLREELRRASRYHRALSVLMLDVDSFKTFNDTYGHPQGDHLLRSIAAILCANVRNVDFVGRYGGEEFIAVLPETAKHDACNMAERIRSAVEEHACVALEDGMVAYRTVSVGVASFPEDALNPAELVQRADEALYRAKRAGKNRVLWA